MNPISQAAREAAKQTQFMTSHELAKLLLAGTDMPIYIPRPAGFKMDADDNYEMGEPSILGGYKAGMDEDQHDCLIIDSRP